MVHKIGKVPEHLRVHVGMLSHYHGEFLESLLVVCRVKKNDSCLPLTLITACIIYSTYCVHVQRSRGLDRKSMYSSRLECHPQRKTHHDSIPVRQVQMPLSRWLNDWPAYYVAVFHVVLCIANLADAVEQSYTRESTASPLKGQWHKVKK